MQPIKILTAITIAILVAIPVFYNLTGSAIHMWDEAIYANNALEMAIDGDPWVLKNDGEVNLYNTKPPLVIWLQSIGIRLFGAGELAIRLPSALASLGIALLLWLFSWKSLKDQRIGAIAILVLFSTAGFVRTHVTRTGDLDTVLIFWITAYALLAFHYLYYAPPNHKKYFAWIGLGVLCAFFSKSVAGFLPLLGIFLAAFSQGRVFSILKKPSLYLVILSVLLLCGGYYLFRESLVPGYWEKVFFSEYQRFTHNVMPWHNHPFSFYLTNMWKQAYFTPYVYLLPIALGLGLFAGDRLRRFTIMLGLFALSYFCLISYPIVKLNYYDAPLYPFLSLIIGIGLVRLVDIIGLKWNKVSTFYKDGILLLLIALLAYSPYLKIVKSLESSLPTDSLEREGHAIRHLFEHTAYDSYKVFMKVGLEELDDQASFYVKAYNHFEQQSIQLVDSIGILHVGDTVLCCQGKFLDSIKVLHPITEIQKIEDCLFFKIEE